MSVFKKVLGAIGRVFVSGDFLQKLIKGIDEYVFGRISRFIMVHTTKSKPNKIFFHTQEDKYCCNPKYICEEIRKRGLKVDMVWRTSNNGRGEIPPDVRIVKGGTYQFFQEIFSSKYIITNSVLWVDKGFTLRRDQILFETWHGSLGFKNFGKKDYKGKTNWILGAIRTGRLTDYCITNSSYVSGQLRKTYWPKTPMLEYGHPRNDIFFDGYAEKRKEIKKRFMDEYKLTPETKLVMYGPTFRDSQDFSCYLSDMDGLIAALTERFGGTWKVMLRYHSALLKVYQARNNIQTPNVIDVTEYSDMQELMSIADVAITDYSSWILDFELQRKPGFLYAPDIHSYEVERGLNYPLTESPFPVAATPAELFTNIRNFDEEAYLSRVESFLEGKHCIEDGHASERVVDKIQELMSGKKK